MNVRCSYWVLSCYDRLVGLKVLHQPQDVWNVYWLMNSLNIVLLNNLTIDMKILLLRLVCLILNTRDHVRAEFQSRKIRLREFWTQKSWIFCRRTSVIPHRSPLVTRDAETWHTPPEPANALSRQSWHHCICTERALAVAEINVSENFLWGKNSFQKKLVLVKLIDFFYSGT